jgi:hypothetical protein
MGSSDGFYVLDAGDRITHVFGALQDRLGLFLGHSFWEASPQARPLFGPYFEAARETGEEVEFTAIYAGSVARRRVVPAGRTLTVYETSLQDVNVRSLGTLRESLEAVASEQGARASARPGRRAHASLRALL